MYTFYLWGPSRARFPSFKLFFKGPCIKRLRNPAVEGSDGLVGFRWGVWWIPGGPGEARWGPVERLLTPNITGPVGLGPVEPRSGTVPEL